MRATLAQHAGTVPDVAGRQVTCLPPPVCLTDPARWPASARSAGPGSWPSPEPPWTTSPILRNRPHCRRSRHVSGSNNCPASARSPRPSSSCALRHTDYLAGLGTELNTIVGGHAASGTRGRRKSLTRSRSHGRRADLVPAVHPLGQPPAHRSHTPRHIQHELSSGPPVWMGARRISYVRDRRPVQGRIEVSHRR
jgi:hypothetical protein